MVDEVVESIRWNWYHLPEERLQMIIDGLDETGGFLIKESELRHAIQSVVEEVVASYVRELNILQEACHKKDLEIGTLLAEMDYLPSQDRYRLDVSLKLVRSGHLDELVKSIAERLADAAGLVKPGKDESWLTG